MEDPDLELFEQYARQVATQKATLQKRVEKLDPSLNARERAEVMTQTGTIMKEMEQVIRKMKVEKSELTDLHKAASCGARIQSMESDLAALRKKFETKKAQSEQADRASLYSGANAGSSQVRGALLGNQAVLERSGQRIQEGLASLNESEAMGSSVLESLGHQRETLERGRDTLGNADATITTARKHLVAMGRRLTTNKMVMYFIMFAMAALILYLFFAKVLK